VQLSRPILFVCFTLAATLVSAQVNFNYNFFQTSGQGLGAVSADFNRDGYPDVAVGTNGAIEVYFSTGQGSSFGPAQSYSLPQDPNDFIAVDVNNDGWPDIVVLPTQGATQVQVLINNGDGTFHTGTPIQLASPAGDYISAGDVNNDGKVDLVIEELVSFVVSATANGSKNDVFVVYKGNGDGTFTRGQAIGLPGLASRPVLYDLNRDGNLDIAAAANKKAVIYWGNGDGTFHGPTTIAASDSNGDEDLTVADFNNDSNPDLAIMTSQFCGSACGVNTVYIYLGDGKGNFTLKSSTEINFVSAGYNVLAADINDDQNMDIVVENSANFGGGIVYALGNGDGTLGSQYEFTGADNNPSGFVARDINLDSRPDVLIPTYMGNGFVYGVNTSAEVNCAPPNSSQLQAKICAPAANGNVSNPITVQAAGNSPIGVKRLEIWVDSTKVTEELSDQIAKQITLSSGVHSLTVVAVDQYLGTSSVTEKINVQ
jgi:FG-GAP-like repeat/FG-GAP repeat/Bacterial Ig domain